MHKELYEGPVEYQYQILGIDMNSTPHPKVQMVLPVVISLKFHFRWPAMGIHGDKSQQERDWVLNGEI